MRAIGALGKKIALARIWMTLPPSVEMSQTARKRSHILPRKVFLMKAVRKQTRCSDGSLLAPNVGSLNLLPTGPEHKLLQQKPSTVRAQASKGATVLRCLCVLVPGCTPGGRHRNEMGHFRGSLGPRQAWHSLLLPCNHWPDQASYWGLYAFLGKTTLISNRCE